MRITNEIKVLRNFILEFHPFYTKEMVKEMKYSELTAVVKEIAKEME